MIKRLSNEKLAKISNEYYCLVREIQENIQRAPINNFDHIAGNLLPSMTPYQEYFGEIGKRLKLLEVRKLRHLRDYFKLLVDNPEFMKVELQEYERYFPDVTIMGSNGDKNKGPVNYVRESKRRLLV
jgi:hypothetical protein